MTHFLISDPPDPAAQLPLLIPIEVPAGAQMTAIGEPADQDGLPEGVLLRTKGGKVILRVGAFDENNHPSGSNGPQKLSSF